MRQESVDFGPCQKKWGGKLYDCQSFLASDCDDKVYSCCEHRQNFHRKLSGTPALCFGTASSAALNELDVSHVTRSGRKIIFLKTKNWPFGRAL